MKEFDRNGHFFNFYRHLMQRQEKYGTIYHITRRRRSAKKGGGIFLKRETRKGRNSQILTVFSDGTDAFSICTVPAVWHGADGAGGRDDRIE